MKFETKLDSFYIKIDAGEPNNCGTYLSPQWHHFRFFSIGCETPFLNCNRNIENFLILNTYCYLIEVFLDIMAKFNSNCFVFRIYIVSENQLVHISC